MIESDSDSDGLDFGDEYNTKPAVKKKFSKLADSDCDMNGVSVEPSTSADNPCVIYSSSDSDVEDSVRLPEITVVNGT